jgi:hypothetical protein
MKINMPKSAVKWGQEGWLAKISPVEGVIKEGVLFLYSVDITSLIEGASFILTQIEKDEPTGQP